MRFLWFIPFGLCLNLHCKAQGGNLVPNPSFEEYNGCPYTAGAVWRAEPWDRVYGSVDYFHECGTDGYGIPFSKFGNEYARSGQAYIGLSLGSLNEFLPEFREYVGISLSSPLTANASYRVMFHVSLADSVWYATRNIGAYLSHDQPTDNLSQLLAIEPQVKYEGEGFLMGKEGWARIDDVYLAQGGENFITIGNFNYDDDTDTLFVEGGGILRPSSPDYWKSFYYFIDDVSVIDVDSLVGVGEQEREWMNINPNPANGNFIIVTERGNGGTFRMLDMAGREVLSEPLHSSRQSINVECIPAGVYVAVVEQRGEVIGRRKVMVE